MEENSESQLDTDASSSADMTDVEEASGSLGNMETVIVVETLTDDDTIPLSEEKQESSDAEVNIPIKEGTSTEKDLQAPILIKLPQPQISSNFLPPRELSIQKDSLTVRTYSRSPHMFFKNSQKSPANTDLSQNTQPTKGISDSSDKLSEKNDLKIPNKEENQCLQKSPVKSELPKKITITNTVDCSSKKTPKKEIKSPTKTDKELQKSPKISEQCKIQTSIDVTDSSSKRTPKKDLKPSKGPIKLIRTYLKPDPTKDVQPPSQINDCSNKTTKDGDNKTIREEETQQLSKDTTVLETEKSSDSYNTVAGTLQSPPLLTLLPKDSETVTAVANEAEKSVESGPNIISNSSVEISEKCSDSVQTIVPDSSEVHGKSISRELKSLIKSAKDSKIISECTQLTTKTRKSRGALDTPSSTPTPMDSDRPIGSRSDTPSINNSSEKLDKTNLKRSMRSQNPEFVNKVKLFLNSVTGKATTKPDSEVLSEDETDEKRVKDNQNESLTKSPKKKKTNDLEPATPVSASKMCSDPYCWRCHWVVEQETNDKPHPPMMCTVCPRSFHFKCLSSNERSKIISDKKWVCPECLIVLHAESSETRSPAMKKISLGSLSQLLQYALDRMMDLNGVEPFLQSVDPAAFPDYSNYVVHPMDLLVMKNNIKEGLYGSTEAFLADAQWIQHNSIIFNSCDGVVSVQSKLTAAARALVRSCKVEMGEIEACPECYAAAHTGRALWFTEVCNTPHMLLWAKLKGFPYWPAKCMSVSSAGLVDVRFFGAHDRAWVPAKDCYLFCEQEPNNFRSKRLDIMASMQEAEQHIRNISRKYGKFVYPPFKTQLDPAKLTEQMKMMIPTFEGEVKAPAKEKFTPRLTKSKSRSNSKGSKSSSNDGEVSDNDENKSQTHKMADGVEIAMVEDFSVEKDNEPTQKEFGAPREIIQSRKRRRSELEEAVITIMEGPKQKRKCVESDPKSQDKQIDNQSDNIEPIDKSPEQQTEKDKITEVTVISTIPLVTTTSETERPPIKMILKTNKSFKTVSPKPSEGIPEKTPPLKLRVMKIHKKKSIEKEKHSDKSKSHKRRNSKNKSLDSTASQLMIMDKSIVEKNTDIVDNSSENNNKTQDEPMIMDDKLEVDNILKVIEIHDQKFDNNSVVEGENVKNNLPEKPKEDEAIKENPSTKNKEPVRSKENISTEIMDSENIKDNNGKINKDTPKVKSNNTPNHKDSVVIQSSEKNMPAKHTSTASPKTAKNRIIFDEDNTSLALIAREGGSKRGSLSGLPTITSVRSLSSPQTIEAGTKTSTPKVVESTGSSIFTPTSTDTVRNMTEAVTKLNKLRSDSDQSLVGKVGVCAFARMPSTPSTDKNINQANEGIEVEVKSEPTDFEDSDRQFEKLNLMNSFSLRPVSTKHAPSSLREVRINKITAGPAAGRKSTAKPTEPKIRPKKTSLQQKKGDDGRSELNSKNSMVYIPIHPPMTQAPSRVSRPVTVNGNTAPITVSRTNVTVLSSNKTTIVPAPPPAPLVMPQPIAIAPAPPAIAPAPAPPALAPSPPALAPAPPALASAPAPHAIAPAPPAIAPAPPALAPAPMPVPVPNTVTVVSVTSQANAVQTFPPLGPIPTSLHNVHTMPLITSVNGQWTFSLQPVMSIGSLDSVENQSTPPSINGRGSAEALPVPAIIPSVNGACASPSNALVAKPGTASTTPVNTSMPKVVVPPLQPLSISAQSSPVPIVNLTGSDDPGTVGEPPRLQHKPLLHPLDVNAPLGAVPPPSTAGPLTAKLNQNAIKLTDFFRTILEDTVERLDEPAAETTSLKLQLEEARWRHKQEIEELKHNHELVLTEMRSTFEKERLRIINETRRAAQVDLEAAVKLAKAKQWCANCTQEAQFYCCWNTSYCDYTCQRAHWTQHHASCTQQRTQDSKTNTDTESNSVNNRLPPPPENLPKTTTAPALSMAPVTRVFSKEQPGGPKSIIVSMMDDGTGTTTVKCVGQFKQSVPTPTQPLMGQSVPAALPRMINKPVNIISNEDIAAKKVVTSGGYLIVGSPNSSTIVSPPRRAQTIQYYS